jgi:hypothetical protein
MARIIHTTGLEISGSQFTQISNDLTASFNITGSGDVIGGKFVIDKGAATGSSFQVLGDGVLFIANKAGGQLNKLSLKALEIDDSNSNSTSFRLGGPIRVGQGVSDSIIHQHELSGSVNITGSMNAIGVNIMSSSRIDPKITSILTETDSSALIQNVTTTGPAYRMDLVDLGGSGSATILLGNQKGGYNSTGFFAKYTTGSNASEGEITMAIGKNGSAALGYVDRFIVQSEPGPISTNSDAELTLSVGGPKTGRREVLGVVTEAASGEFAQFAAGVDKQFNRKRFVGFEYSAASTSSQAGFYSSSLNGTGVANFNTNAVPFGVVAGGGGLNDLTNTAFYIDRGGSLGASAPVTASLQISRGGSIDMEGHITASGNISASGDIIGNNGSFTTSVTTPEISGNTEITGDLQVVNIAATHITASGNIIFSGNVSGSGTNSSYFGDEFNAHGNDANSGFTLLSLGAKPSIYASGASLEIGNATNSTQTGIHLIGEVTASANISASGDITGNTGSFQHINLPQGAAIKSLPGGNVEIISEDGAFLQITDSFIFDNNGATFAVNAQGDVSDIRHITASGNISASGYLAVNDIHANNFRLMTPLDATAGPFPMIKTTGNHQASTAKIFIGDMDEFDTNSHLIIDPPNESATFLELNTTISGSLLVRENATLQGGRPITTHTTSPISSSLTNAGRYHIVGGNLTCSIVQSTAVIGAEYEFFQTSSAGNFLFESASGITVISKNGSMRLAQQGSAAVLKKVNSTIFHLMGDLT